MLVRTLYGMVWEIKSLTLLVSVTYPELELRYHGSGDWVLSCVKGHRPFRSRDEAIQWLANALEKNSAPL